MKTRHWLPAFAAAAVYTLFDADPALAWGPATHVQLGTEILRQLPILPGAMAAILSRFVLDYLYGNVAADIVFAKRWSRVKQFCHHWTTGFRLLESARDERAHSFALGYLSHLAADTVAHGKYVPRQLAVTRCSMSFGHFYWEMRADNAIARPCRDLLKHLSETDFTPHHEAMGQLLTATFLPHEVNLRLFRRMNRLVTRRRWRHSVAIWDRHSRWDLSEHLLAQYHQESLDRILSVLTEQQRSPVLHEDPSGTSALLNVRVNRRYVRRLRRRGWPLDHLMLEAVASHAPAPSSGSSSAAA